MCIKIESLKSFSKLVNEFLSIYTSIVVLYFDVFKYLIIGIGFFTTQVNIVGILFKLD